MNIWIVNPFDDLPDEAGRPLRYWQLSRTLTAQGHAVVWWSSDFSHRLKSYRSGTVRTMDGFQVRLVHVPAYQRNVGLARLRNHRLFGSKWEAMARRAVASGEVARPDRIIVSMPPIETAKHAFRLREIWGGPVVVDVQDAWPETFLRLIPGPRWLGRMLGSVCFATQFRAARCAYRGADRISACAQTYLDLAVLRGATAPTLICCHGTRLGVSVEDREFPERFREDNPLRLLHVGAMGRSYDLATVVAAVARLHRAGCPISLHLVGQEPSGCRLRRIARWHGVPISDDAERVGVHFHGYLKGVDLRAWLLKAHVGLVAMDPGTLVGIPNKLVDYCAAGLPVLSCLGGETAQLLDRYHAGIQYGFRDVTSLSQVLTRILQRPALLDSMARGSGGLARDHFDARLAGEALAGLVVRAAVAT